MITVKLKEIYLVSVVLFLIHGIEEYLTQFPTIDPIFTGIARHIPIDQNLLFILLQIVWLLFLTAIIIIAPSREKVALRLMVLVGLVFIFELEHLIRAAVSQSYYPGLVTAVLLAIIGFTFWNEFSKVNQRRR